MNRRPDVGLKTAEISGGKIESGGFYPGIKTIKVASSGNERGQFEMTFTAAAGAVITRDVPATAENIQKMGAEKISRLTIKTGVPAAFDAPDPVVSSTTAETPKVYPIFVTQTVDGKEIVTEYEIAAYRASELTSGETLSYSPSSGKKVSVTDALIADDSNPDGVFRALTGSYKTRLGLMGGFVEYRLDRPIENDSHNKYGIDFIIYGAAASASEAFPGSVQVARDEDGDGQPDQWYTLSGSEYYADGTEHSVSVSYENLDGGLGYLDSSGLRAGQIASWQGQYPDPVFSSRWNSIVKSDESTTFTGDLLSNRNPAFGYANVHPMGLNNARPSRPDKPVNPYRSGDLYTDAKGDGFDLAWAVDKNGLPVELESVDFIRVSSSYLDAANADGTVITSIVDVTGESKNPGVSSDLQGLKINGEDFPLEEGVYSYKIPLDGAQDVKISASTFGANFYVNEEALGHETESSPIHFDGYNTRVVRLLLQSEEKAPKLYHLILEPKIQVNTITLDKSSLELKAGEKFLLTPTITPSSANAADAVKWFSTAPDIARVSGGLVTAVDEGTTTISAQIGGKFTQCLVTVRYASVNEVIAAIAALPDTITASDRDAVETARAFYDSLTGGEKKQVGNYAKLQSAEAALAELPDPAEAVNEVIELIDNLPRNITIYDETVILKARAAYNALNEELKAAVTNYDLLLKVERGFKELKLSDDRVARVIEKIGLIPLSVSLFSLDDGIKIRDAREAYDLLTDTQKTYVSNYPALVLAEERYTAFITGYNHDVERVQNAINALETPVSISEKARVLEARRLYDELPAEKQALADEDTLRQLTTAEIYLGLAPATGRAESVYSYMDQIREALEMLPEPLTYGRFFGDRSSVSVLEQLFDQISAADKDAYLQEEWEEFNRIKATLKNTAAGADLEAIKESFKTRIYAFPVDYTYRDYTNAYGLQSLVNSNDWIGLDNVLKDWFNSDELEQSYKDKYNNVVAACYNAFQDNAAKMESIRPYVDAVTRLGVLDVKNSEHKAAAEALLAAFNYLDSYTQQVFQTTYPEQYAVVQSVQAAMEAYWYKPDHVKSGIDWLPAVIAAGDKEDIEQLRKDYEALPQELKELVDNLSKLTQAEADLATAQAADEQTINSLISKIASLPELITLEDKELIESAEADYRDLTQSQRDRVTNYAKLQAARQSLDGLYNDQAMIKNATDRINAIETPVELANSDLVRAARAACDALTQDQKEAMEQSVLQKLADAELALAEIVPGGDIDTEKIQNVIELINNIPDGARYNDPAVKSAREAYNKLNDDEKLYVTNYNKLLAAEQNGSEEEDNQVEADKVIALINQIPDGAKKGDAAVTAARAAYDLLSEAQKKLVTNYAKLTAAEANDPSAGGQVNRTAGGNRYDTSTKTALEAYPSGAETVIIARGDDQGNFADALAASYLAGVEKAPILLTSPGSLPQEIEAAIKKLGAKKAYVLGGELAVSQAVASKLKSLGLEVERIQGQNRYATAAAIAARGGQTETAIVVSGFAPADSLVAGPLAFSREFPILLADKNSVPAETKQAIADLGIKNIIVIGGESAVSKAVYSELKAKERYCGQSRIETSLDVAEKCFKTSEDFSIVGYLKLADAVGAAVSGNPIIYVKNDISDVKDYLKGAAAADTNFTIFGGALAVSNTVENELKKLLQ